MSDGSLSAAPKEQSTAINTDSHDLHNEHPSVSSANEEERDNFRSVNDVIGKASSPNISVEGITNESLELSSVNVERPDVSIVALSNVDGILKMLLKT